MRRYTCLVFTLVLLATAGSGCHPARPQPGTGFHKEKRSLEGCRKIIIDTPFEGPALGYRIVNTAHAEDDPCNWSLWGSNNQQKWTKIDQRLNQSFCARYMEREYSVAAPRKYRHYAFVIETRAGDTLPAQRSHQVQLLDRKPDLGWEEFAYPDVIVHYDSPQAPGSQIYREVIPDPETYIRHHAREVCRILFRSDDEIPAQSRVARITYELKEDDGISAESGRAPDIFIRFSTRYIQRIAQSSILEFCDETRGILCHELTHGYQYQPQGCGTYDGKSEYWAAIEGMADAVRIDAGFHKQRRPDPKGHWLQGYATTGFFLQWFRTKDPDALRKFHATMRDLNPWSFDAGIKAVFGKETSVRSLWEEYVRFLANNPSYHHYVGP